MILFHGESGTRKTLVVALLRLLILSGLCCILEAADAQNVEDQKRLIVERDFRWPNRRLNVLIDTKSINETERQVLTALLDQLEHKTCIRVHRLPTNVNPFDTRQLPEWEHNFIYIFKAQFGLSHSDHPPLGLSTFGCVQQGRQSMVLGGLAFRWPELVLRYHLLRALGVANLTRPEAEVRRRLHVLPMSQKIGDDESDGDGVDSSGRHHQAEPFDPAPTFFAYSTFAGLASGNNNNNKTKSKPRASDQDGKPGETRVVPVQYLSEEDLKLVKDLYNCSDYSNRLSPKPLNEIMPAAPADHHQQQQQLESPIADFYSSQGEEKLSNLHHHRDEGLSKSSLETSDNSSNLQAVPASGAPDSTIDSLRINETKIDDAAKTIMNQLISEGLSGDTTSEGTADKLEGTIETSSQQPSPAPPNQCKPLESCAIEEQPADGRTSALDDYLPQDSRESGSGGGGGGGHDKPMLLKLDEFHAQDPQLQQANQMKLSQFSNSTIETYRLMNSGSDLPVPVHPDDRQQQQFRLPAHSTKPGKSEMLISFEQTPNLPTSDPVSALASSQVLKLCSCTCQTMSPAQPSTRPQPLPDTTTKPPTTTTQEPVSTLPVTSEPITQTEMPTTTTQKPKPTTMTTTEGTTELPTTPSSMPVPTTTKKPSTTEGYPEPTTADATVEPTEEPTTLSTDTRNGSNTSTMPTKTDVFTEDPLHTVPTVSTTSHSGGGSMADNPCEQVQWVKPNKTVYSSAKIVWDVDRGNQNYFLCNNQVNDELIPGKTHGFSCKVGNEGRAHELHNFSVLTKPEHVSLAWIQRSSGALGKTNQPVIGGYSKNQDPLVVSRCLVRDENFDVITLIGYVNTNGVGLFPFDDIQIECSQYDVLACVS